MWSASARALPKPRTRAVHLRAAGKGADEGWCLCVSVSPTGRRAPFGSGHQRAEEWMNLALYRPLCPFAHTNFHWHATPTPSLITSKCAVHKKWMHGAKNRLTEAVECTAKKGISLANEPGATCTYPQNFRAVGHAPSYWTGAPAACQINWWGRSSPSRASSLPAFPPSIRCQGTHPDGALAGSLPVCSLCNGHRPRPRRSAWQGPSTPYCSFCRLGRQQHL